MKAPSPQAEQVGPRREAAATTDRPGSTGTGPAGATGEPSRARRFVPSTRPPWRPAAALVGVALLYLVPTLNLGWLAGSSLSFQSILFFPVGIYVLLAIGLDIMVGRAGLPNLGYAVFFAVGAYTTAMLTTKASVPYFVALAAAVAAGVVAGALLSGVSFRARGHYLAIITLGAGLITVDLLSNVHVFGGTLGLSSIPSPGRVFGLDFTPTTPRNYDWLVLTAILLAAGSIYRIARGRIGRGWTAIRDDEPTAAQMGVRVRRWKVAAFAIGGGIGALGGALYAGQVGYIDPSSFTLNLSILVLAAVVLVGKGRVWSVALGAVIVGYLPERFYVIEKWNTLAFGAVLVVVMLLQPNGLAAAVRSLVDRLRSRGATAASDAATSDTATSDTATSDTATSDTGASDTATVDDSTDLAAADVADAGPPELATVAAPATQPATRPGTHAECMLEVRDLTMQFGGLRAVDDLSFGLRAGEVTSLIGPNGAGKTTVINLVTGVYRPTHGSVLLDGAAIEHRSGEWRARHGVARTFQNIRVFTSMTVLDNVLVAAESGQASGVPGALFGTPRFSRERRDALAHAKNCLALVGLAELADRRATTLSYGAQRRLEIARALALRPRVLLLDEPAAGSNPAEKAELGRIIRRLADRGYAVLLIEHDMGLVMSISEHIVVMNFGVKIAEGRPEEVRSDEQVVAAYLGDDHDAA